MLYCENANDHGILIRTGQANSVMRPSSTSLAIRLTGNRAVSRPAVAAPRGSWKTWFVSFGWRCQGDRTRLRLFRTRIVWIALRYHDGVTRVRYLLTNALSACGYGQRRRGAPAAASAEALMAVARHARVLLQCMSLLLALNGPFTTSAPRPLSGLFHTTNARCEHFAV
jgi:hypothetical protein